VPVYSGVNISSPITALLTSHDYRAYKTHAQSSVPSVNAKPLDGLAAFGRAYAAWLTSAEWFEASGWKHFGSPTLQAWLDAAGENYADWDPEDVLLLARMWQAGNVGSVGGDGDWTHALAGIRSRVLIMPCRTDQYFTPKQSEREKGYLKEATLSVIESVWGHVAGGGANEVDTRWMSDRIEAFLAERA
jgi:homoserine acetyltransferase